MCKKLSKFAAVKKAPSKCKRLKKKKKPSSLLLAKIFKKLRGNFFLKKIGQDFNFWWFHGSKKLFFTKKSFTKRERQKNQENSAHGFEENYLANLTKFMQDRIKPYKVGALRVGTGYNFFCKKHLVKVS